MAYRHLNYNIQNPKLKSSITISPSPSHQICPFCVSSHPLASSLHKLVLSSVFSALAGVISVCPVPQAKSLKVSQNISLSFFTHVQRITKSFLTLKHFSIPSSFPFILLPVSFHLHYISPFKWSSFQICSLQSIFYKLPSLSCWNSISGLLVLQDTVPIYKWYKKPPAAWLLPSLSLHALRKCHISLWFPCISCFCIPPCLSFFSPQVLHSCENVDEYSILTLPHDIVPFSFSTFLVYAWWGAQVHHPSGALPPPQKPPIPASVGLIMLSSTTSISCCLYVSHHIFIFSHKGSIYSL